MLIGIISDAHGDVHSFLHVIELLKKLNVEKIYHLGDIIGYVPSLKILDVIPTLKIEIEFLLGNHEVALLSSNFDETKDEIYKHSDLALQLDNSDAVFLQSLVQEKHIILGNKKVHMSHGGPGNPIFGYMYPDSPIPETYHEYDFIFCGNTHRAFIKTSRSTVVVNVGSCSFPRDIGARGSYALFDTEKGEVVLHRFDLAPFSTRFHRKVLREIHPSIIDLYNRG